MRKKNRKKRKQKEPEFSPFEQDEYFYFIAGYTPGGAPYGITWEEAVEQGLLDDDSDGLQETDIDVFE